MSRSAYGIIVGEGFSLMRRGGERRGKEGEKTLQFVSRERR